jgi:hypothetical protein
MKPQLQVLTSAHFDDFASQVSTLRREYSRYLESRSHNFKVFSVAKAQMERRSRKPYGQLCYYVPFWYSPVFDISESQAVTTIALANIYLYHYWTLKDDLVDGHLDMTPSDGLIIDLILGKSIELFLQADLDGRLFLSDLNRYMEEALGAELFLKKHKGEVSDYSESDFIMMGNKAALLKASAAALSNVAQDRRRLGRLEEVLLTISIALQLVDDLTDWKHDLKIKNFTFPLAGAIAILAPTSLEAIEQEQVSRIFYERKIDDQVLMLAIEYLDTAKALLRDLDNRYLHSFVNAYIADIQAARLKIKSPLYEWRLGDVLLGKQLLQS